jgi:hypothetical protein
VSRRRPAAVAIAVLLLVSACAHGGDPAPVRSTGGASPPPGTTLLSCDSPIGIEPSPERSHRAVLDAVALDVSATLQANATGGSDPHRLFAKTGLLVHAGTASEIDVPDAWASRLAIAWGNHASEWTTRLRIPACPRSGPGGDWLVYPGGLSVDEPACVPLEVRAGGKVVTVRLAVGVRC